MIMQFKPLKDVFIGIITNHAIEAALVPKLIKWSSQGAEVCIVTERLLIDLGRNRCVKEFLKSKKKYLLFIDSDTIPDVDGPMRLRKMKKDVAAGVYNLLMTGSDGRSVTRPSCFIKTFDSLPIIEAVPIVYDTGIQEVEIAATGYLMIRRSIFDKIKEPWFEFQWLNAQHTQFHGEDIRFCRKLKEANIPIYCDTSAKALHYKSLFI